MKRRDFLLASGALGLGLTQPLLFGCAQRGESALQVEVAGEAAADALRRLAAAMQGVGFVGPTCRQRLALDSVELTQALLQRLRATGQARLGDALHAVIAEDFARAEIEDIAGWQLSRSECLLAALAAHEQGLQTAQTYGLADIRDGVFVQIDNWGPQSTVRGQVFNRQPDGHGGIWIRAYNAPAATQLWFENTPLYTIVGPEVLTSGLHGDLLEEVIQTPGSYRLSLVDPIQRLRQPLGTFIVEEAKPLAVLVDGSMSTVFCQVEGWGPDSTKAGEVFNPQPSGSAAFWVRIGCAPGTAQLLLGDWPLITTVHSGLVTAQVPNFAELGPGVYPLLLHDHDSGERLLIGEFVAR